MHPKPNDWVLEHYTQDPKTGRWVSRYADPLAGYFADTPRGTPVVAMAIGDHLEPCPLPHPDNDPRATRRVLKRMVFWGLLLRKEADQEIADGTPLYRLAVVLRKDLDSKRDLYPLDAAREDDAPGVARLFREQRDWVAQDLQFQAETAQRKAAQESVWQAQMEAKLQADKARAESLGLALEEYLDGVKALRQMRYATRPGCCLICKRPLSLKTSVTRGVGPECFNRLSVAERISAAASTVAKLGGAVA